MNRAVVGIILCALLCTGTILYAAGTDEARALVEGFKGQIEILKWVGGAMVSGLVAAVGILWGALRKSSEEVRRISERSALSADRLADSIEALRREVEKWQR